MSIPRGKDELRLFVIARNESLRLPYFLRYYLDRGVDRIFLIDNDSTDNTIEIALQFPNVHVFKITESFKNFWNWIEFFLNKYGKNRWCLVVDVDELLSYPFEEITPLKTLVNYLEKNKFDAIRSFLLDIYSDKPIIETNYCPNNNPLESCPYFDPTFNEGRIKLFDKKRWMYFETIIYFGGMRERVFNKIARSSWNYHLSKISLFKYSGNVYVTEGMHSVNGAQIADITGVVFHTKYMQDFIKRVMIESQREVHFGNAMEYKIYNKACLSENDITLCFKDSVRFENSRQLIKLGIMRTSVQFNNYLAEKDLDLSLIIRKLK
ncbi:glycosyltransferase family 2 protein [Draconibacterium sp. IB214405]|uniref:glycosyltransferase family 2 protein n=1 Tax=Draconibacterium sp. IB214405 TaxID=3097352 RepID=UPI002A0CCFC4|nr:glycosyltransferase family 2 protein [Draconibacterium sp. IB214405]MDX8341769.1 glycosyltransferase family 2 protein [Draconibacterium sp. IB214405]